MKPINTPGGNLTPAQTIDAAEAPAVALDTATPQAVGTAAAGSASKASKSDHVHAHGNQLGGALHANAGGGNAGFLTDALNTSLGKLIACFGVSDATHFGAFGTTPAVLASAYTLTYNTPVKTSAAQTVHAITDSSGGTASTTALAAQSVTAGGAVDPTAALLSDVNAIFVVQRNNIATVNAELTALKADHLALQKLVVALITDLKSYGLMQ